MHKRFSEGERAGAFSPVTAESCVMCEAVQPIGAVHTCNAPLLQTEHFVVMPSLGSLVEGWLLIVPRVHYLSAASLPSNLLNELDELKGTVKELIIAHYGAICFFEHGPADSVHKTGCGVDHAHIHAVPVSGDVLGESRAFLPGNVVFSCGDLAVCRAAIASGQDYLYFEDRGGQVSVATCPEFYSQTFRKAIATLLGKPDRYDWKTFPALDTVKATIAKLTGPLPLAEFGDEAI